MSEKAPEQIRLVKRDGIFDSYWYFPDAAIMPFDSEIVYVPESALATVRREEREAAFKVQCDNCAEGSEPVFDKPARWFYHELGHTEIGCAASKLRIAALERAATTDKENS